MSPRVCVPSWANRQLSAAVGAWNSKSKHSYLISLNSSYPQTPPTPLFPPPSSSPDASKLSNLHPSLLLFPSPSSSTSSSRGPPAVTALSHVCQSQLAHLLLRRHMHTRANQSRSTGDGGREGDTYSSLIWSWSQKSVCRLACCAPTTGSSINLLGRMGFGGGWRREYTHSRSQNLPTASKFDLIPNSVSLFLLNSMSYSTIKHCGALQASAVFSSRHYTQPHLVNIKGTECNANKKEKKAFLVETSIMVSSYQLCLHVQNKDSSLMSDIGSLMLPSTYFSC